MINLKELTENDYPFVSEIYMQGIRTQHATFESGPPDWEEFKTRFLDFSKVVALEGNRIIGWAALSSVSSRCVYAGVCEVSVYVHEKFRGKGVGKELLSFLIHESEKNNIWTLQAGIFPENHSSIKIHLDLGFRVVGTREKIGKMNGVWRDTLLLERRSKLENLI